MFAAAVPLFFVLIYAVPAYRHLLFTLCATAAAILGSREVAALLARRAVAGRWHFAAACSTLFPIVAYLENWGIVSGYAFGAAAAAVVALVLAVPLLLGATQRGRSGDPLGVAGATLLASLYPGLFIGYIVRLAGLSNPQWLLLTFFVAVFSNDTVAYLAGKLAGGRTALGLPASPTKTAVGYVTGIGASVAALIVAQRVFPGAPQFGTLEAALGGAAMGVCAAVGDLLESALKRAAQVKDSGVIIPGRGGLLDSIDSLMLCAPLFYLWMQRVYGAAG